MSRYLVGKSDFFNQKWEFNQALAAAGDGDIIELEEGFCPFYEQNNEKIRITKSVTIEGHLDSQGRLTNVIDGVFVKNGATVTLRNLEVRKAVDKTNNINVDGAVLIAENVILTSLATEGENYPVVYLLKGAKASFVHCKVAPGNLHDGNYRVYEEDSTLEIKDSIIHARVWAVNSKLDIQDAQISYSEANALVVQKNSVVTLLSSVLEGGRKCEDGNWYPCVRVNNSSLEATGVTVKQPGYWAALNTVNSRVTLHSGWYDSVELGKSEASIGHIGVVENFSAQENSHVRAKEIGIVGKANGKINLYMNKKSVLEAEALYFGRLSDPNIKVERNTTLSAGVMKQAAYDPETWEFVTDEQGRMTVTAYDPEIAYFGELTAFEQLNQMIGIAGVKETVKEFVAIAELNKRREQQGFKNSTFSLHSLFLGNPGTGKTTVARLLGKILYEKGIIRSEIFVETSRSDLIGRYVGETAPKTRAVLESALGGVLFIDEAYSLYEGEAKSWDYGTEAINEILKFMEDHRQDIVLIFAGYTQDMERFLESNEGLKSRIPNTFVFEDYTEEELIQIGLNDLHAQNYEIDEKAYANLVHQKHAVSDDNSNGRWARNLNEKLIRKMAVRLAGDPKASLTLITQEDIDGI